MAKVKYLGEPGGAKETTQFGYSFTDGKSVDVTDAKHLAKFRGNRFFDVSDGKAEKPAQTGLKAVHVAGGRFVIKDGDNVIKSGLNKEDAHAFNDLSDEEKAEYVKD